MTAIPKSKIQNPKLELLSPAKNLECGLAAIHHGADAVYIGAPRFGAREAAGNSIGEIEKLAAGARIFGVKTYVALNTILYDNELAEAEKIINQVYEAGADALIIQDFGILEMNLPPISLHASTQMNNFTVEKVKFLEAAGFKRAVLARELSLEQIATIADQTNIELEAFVHGSLCVSLSGQCFMSHAMGGRSANRGACAQPCRKKYSLIDSSGKVIIRDKHLLSLKDLNRSKSIRELAAAGIRSFKIEGRLKDLDYVKNITAYYRKELDQILEEKPEYLPASNGKTSLFFSPDPARTFHRGSTEYYLDGRKDPVANMESPKSTGEELGVVTRITLDSFQLSGSIAVSNNDGLTFTDRNGESMGLKINKVENGVIYPDRMKDVFVGARLFRNYDHQFQMTLTKKTSERKIPLSLSLRETDDGFELSGNSHLKFELSIPKIQANDPSKSRENILRQLAKFGDTPFYIKDIDTGGNERYFFTAQQLNELRRGLLSAQPGLYSTASPIELKSDKSGPLNPGQGALQIGFDSTTSPYKLILDKPNSNFHFENNISNSLAMQFYRRLGIENPEMAVEKRAITGRLQVMITKHCLQYELGYCARFGGKFPSEYSTPFYLKDGDQSFSLEFDCKNCMMKIFKEETSNG